MYIPKAKEKIKNKDILDMVAIMSAGIFSNPSSSDLIRNPYERQQIIQELIQETYEAIKWAGIDVVKLIEDDR